VVVADATTITAATAPNGEGAADVVVTNPGGLSGALAAGFTYVDVRPMGGLELGLVPRRGAASLRLLARLNVAAGRVFDPALDGITLALIPPAGTPVVLTVPRARFVANRRRDRFRFADSSGRTAGGATKLVVRTAGTGVVLRARVEALPLAAVDGLAVEVTSGPNRFAREATCTPRGRARQLHCQ
jgi:hypothetical protein